MGSRRNATEGIPYSDFLRLSKVRRALEESRVPRVQVDTKCLLVVTSDSRGLAMLATAAPADEQ